MTEMEHDLIQIIIYEPTEHFTNSDIYRIDCR
jgi:hypothetical protein